MFGRRRYEQEQQVSREFQKRLDAEEAEIQRRIQEEERQQAEIKRRAAEAVYPLRKDWDDETGLSALPMGLYFRIRERWQETPYKVHVYRSIELRSGNLTLEQGAHNLSGNEGVEDQREAMKHLSRSLVENLIRAYPPKEAVPDMSGDYPPNKL